MEETKQTDHRESSEHNDIEKHEIEEIKQAKISDKQKQSNETSQPLNGSDEFNFRKTHVKNTYDEYGLNEIVSIEYYKLSQTKVYVIFPLLLIFTVGIIPLISKWNLSLKLFLYDLKLKLTLIF